MVIAHRLKTIRTADRVVVLDEGRNAETGTHDDLLYAKGVYAKLWTTQHVEAGWKSAFQTEERLTQP